MYAFARLNYRTYQVYDPVLFGLLGVTFYDTVNETILKGILRPIFFQAINLKFVDRDSTGCDDHTSEEVIIPRIILAVQNQIVRRGLEASRQCLLNIDVLYAGIVKVSLGLQCNRDAGDSGTL